VDNVFEQVCRRLGAAQTLLCVTHRQPDGDGLGAMVALTLAARAAGRNAHMLLAEEVPRRYAFLFADEEVAGLPDFGALAESADAIVILDTSAPAQLGELQATLTAHSEKTIVIDHHATVGQLGAVQWIDTSAAATAVMVSEALEALGWPVRLPAAEALMTAVASDTGWLRFANTDSRCLHAVARWLDIGIRPDRLYQRLYQAARPQRLKLLGRMLESLELHCADRLAVMVIRLEDFAATGAGPDETENLVNEALRIGTVETAILLVGTEDGVRVSLRSRDAVNVAEIAERFGGGGHQRAAGLRLAEDIDAVKDKLLPACRRALEQACKGLSDTPPG